MEAKDNSAAQLADAITQRWAVQRRALLSTYSGEELAAFFEGLTLGAFDAGRYVAYGEVASERV